MKPQRDVYIAAESVTPFIGKGNPAFITARHADHGKRENPLWKSILQQLYMDYSSSKIWMLRWCNGLILGILRVRCSVSKRIWVRCFPAVSRYWRVWLRRG